MASYSVAQAKDKLSALIEEARSGVPVTITKHGREVVELRAVSVSKPKPVSKTTLDWIKAQTADLPIALEDSGTLMRRIRDEEDVD